MLLICSNIHQYFLIFFVIFYLFICVYIYIYISYLYVLGAGGVSVLRYDRNQQHNVAFWRGIYK